MIDPRRSIVNRRLSAVTRVVAFCSAKGGVGKTVCACLSALLAARRGMTAGLLDLDFQGASAHVVLGIEPRFPEEKGGIVPLPAAPGLSLMTVAAFTGERALPLRGSSVTDAILELLAVTIWGARDLLCIDMPPGIGDEVLDLISLIPQLETVVVSTPSAVSVKVVERMLTVLLESDVRVDGVVSTMTGSGADPVRGMAARHGVAYAGEVRFDATLEERIGKPGSLLESEAASDLERALGAMRILT
jgi:ATP-binding protein involved in chromosome partitioning